MTREEFEIWLANPRELCGLLEAVEGIVYAHSSREADRAVHDVVDAWSTVFPDEDEDSW